MISPNGDINKWINFQLNQLVILWFDTSKRMNKNKSENIVFQALIDNNGFKWWWKQIDTIVALGDNHEYRNFCSVTKYSFLPQIISGLKAYTKTISMCQHNPT